MITQQYILLNDNHPGQAYKIVCNMNNEIWIEEAFEEKEKFTPYSKESFITGMKEIIKKLEA